MEPAKDEKLLRVRTVLDEVKALLLDHHEGEIVEVPNVWGRLVMDTYSRMRSHLVSVSILVDEGFPEEALELSRTMLTDSLLLMDLASRPDDRMALAFGYYNDSVTALDHLGKAATSAGLPRADEWPVGVAQRREQLFEAMRRHGVAKVKRTRNEATLARLHGRADEVWDFKLMSTMLHRVDLAQTFRRREGETVHLYMRNKDPDILSMVLASAMRSALHAHAATAAMFGWSDAPGETDRLITSIESIFPDEDTRASGGQPSDAS